MYYILSCVGPLFVKLTSKEQTYHTYTSFVTIDRLLAAIVMVSRVRRTRVRMRIPTLAKEFAVEITLFRGTDPIPRLWDSHDSYFHYVVANICILQFENEKYASRDVS